MNEALLSLPKELLIKEAKRRFESLFEVEKFCFKEQVEFIKDPHPFKTAVCSRRSGKTVACAAHMIHTAITNPKRVCLYITLSRANAKKIIWKDLIDINRNYELQGKANETELSISFPNGSVIYLSGASDKTEIDKFRGLAIALCYLDEAQSFRPYIESLIEDVISKALFDYNGTLCLIGTPGPIKAGYFYEATHNSNWSHHHWTMFQNPHLEIKSGKKAEEHVQRELDRKGVSRDDPGIQRECFGLWVDDPSSLVLKYDSHKNHYTSLPPYDDAWAYVIGIDVGFDDADALAVIGWNEKVKQAYLIEEQLYTKQGITELAHQVEALIEKYNPDRIVMDTGGLGKKIAEELRRRFSLPILAADKARKFEFLELLNDAMRTKSFFASKDSRFAQDTYLLTWDYDASTPEKLKISDKYHSDIIDAVLYAFRESLHWLSEADPPKVEINSPKWMEDQLRAHQDYLIEKLHEQKQVEAHERGDW